MAYRKLYLEQRTAPSGYHLWTITKTVNYPRYEVGFEMGSDLVKDLSDDVEIDVIITAKKESK